MVVGNENPRMEAGEDWAQHTQTMPSMLEVLATVGRSVANQRLYLLANKRQALICFDRL